MKKIYIVIGIVVLVLLLSWSHLFPAHTASPIITDPNNLPGIQIGVAPWSPEIAHLRSRLTDIGLPALVAEGSALHIHQHLDLTINGNSIPVPAGIGINKADDFLSPVHTHNTSGIIHVESTTVSDYTLGEFFDIWGVRFTSNCIGGYCTDATHTLKVYANGALVSGDPRTLALTAHQEIMVVYGDASSTPAIVSSYAFEPGY